MKKFLALFAIAFSVIFALTGCAPASEFHPTPTPEPARIYQGKVIEQVLPDGGEVLCVWLGNGSGGGLSCDWEGYHAERDR